MIERFNFYDVYGYLLPGFTWLLLLALPFHTIFQFTTASIPEFTAVLAVGYVAGHFLAGLARGLLKSESHDIGEGSPVLVQRSVAVLSKRYAFRDKVRPEIRQQLGKVFAERFKLPDPLTNPDTFDVEQVKRMFFLCRSALTQSKVAGYVEQYQGMSSMTRSLSFATWTTGAYYSCWAVTSAVMARETRPGRWFLTVAILIAGWLVGWGARAAIDRETARSKMPVARFNLRHAESGLLTVLLIATAMASARWHPLSHRASLGFAAAAGLMWLAALRFRTASEALNGSWIQAIYEDFVVLQTAPKPNKNTEQES
jgi:hypothetical protein